MNLIQTLSFTNEVEEAKIRETLYKVGNIAFVNEIGATKEEVVRYFNVSERTVERYLKEYQKEFLCYGEILYESKVFAGDKKVAHKINRKTRKMVVLNKRHLLLLACLLVKASDVARAIVGYLLGIEEIASKDMKLEAIEKSMFHYDNLKVKRELKDLRSQLKKAKPLIEFAETVIDDGKAVSLNEFSKVTYEKLKFGRNRMFAFLKEIKILNRKNIPSQKYIDRGYFSVKYRFLGGANRCQPLLTGKGQIWLFDTLKKKMEV